jgi:protein-S-isoprenylcysteine O-methyltransferase Ste14
MWTCLSGVRVNGLLIRALLAFLALPGTVAYLVPLLLAPDTRDRQPLQWVGIVLVIAGSALLVWCVRDFYVAGRGTLAPWSPPRRLVTTGPYRRSRNPMYVAITILLFGWATWFASTTLLVYALAVLVAFHLRILTYEEPRLAASFGTEWTSYRTRVRRWL